ncbi:hypothetical protein KEM56_007487 [Ascosphaera pollenicola]|nr:hypothetical protein KEM56_007487 [Ascosphaera pollenicola]
MDKRELSSNERPKLTQRDGRQEPAVRFTTPFNTSRVDGPSRPPAYRSQSARFSEHDTRARRPLASRMFSEETSLLGSHSDGRSYSGVPSNPRPATCIRRANIANDVHADNKLDGDASQFYVPDGNHGATGTSSREPVTGMSQPSFSDDRVWYDQFTSTDWVHDSIADGIRLRKLHSRKDFAGRLLAGFDALQGWILAAAIGCVVAFMAYFVDITEESIFDIKEGFCTDSWFSSSRRCCPEGAVGCAWKTWAEVVGYTANEGQWANFAWYVVWAVVLSSASCALTLLTKTTVPSQISLSTLDENLGASVSTKFDQYHRRSSTIAIPDQSPTGRLNTKQNADDMVYYAAAGSGVAEVKVILSGFVLHGYLGFQTLVVKILALILSVASGLSLGKEGPYVHIGTCIGNIACRVFSKYHSNDGKRREVLSAAAASGVAVAFGAPIGGVLFSLEEVSYYFPTKTMFRTFFCSIAAALSLKFLNPYGTGKIVLFEVRYISDWAVFELLIFMFIGFLGGAVGALFIKASRIWAKSFRRLPVVREHPMFEVVLVALITGVTSFWNRYTKLPVSELLFELASPCETFSHTKTGLCPAKEDIGGLIGSLSIALLIKSFLTIITFGIKVPAGIYVPSMVAGGLMGRIIGHMAQYLYTAFPTHPLFQSCASKPGVAFCINPGVYALVAAGSTMCGVTRLTITLAVILFELTGNLDYVLPFSLAILCAKWTADSIEPLSIYDLLTDMNCYPYLDNKLQPGTELELGDIVSPVRQHKIIDITSSPLVPARELRAKLEGLLRAGELDGGLPILSNNILVGLIPVPTLEFALDKLENEQTAMCLMSRMTSYVEIDTGDCIPTDLTPYIDFAPVSLDSHSPINLVYQCFVKLGLRYMCVLQCGQYAGLVHKKSFVRFIKEKHGELDS